MQQPNILLILTDQQRYDALGCYGADWVQTPHLDRLASEGVLFENCYVNSTICTPSRASLLTGKHLPGHGVYKLHDILPEDAVLFPKRLQQLGYTTALFGKLHVSGRLYEANQRHPNDGFDIYEWCLEGSIHLDSEFNGYSKWLQEQHPAFYRELKEKGRDLRHIPQEYHFTHWAAARTIDFINQHDENQPFFCMMSVFDPHNPYEDYPLDMLALVADERIPKPLFYESDHKRPYGINQEERHSYLGNCNSFSEEDFRKMRCGYFTSIALIDLEVGRVLTVLAESGQADNTLVIFTSDHGDMLGDHRLLVKGAFFYDACTKVPLIMRWPQSQHGLRTSALVQLHDVAATVLAAAGMPPEEIQSIMPDSKNLTPLLHGNTTPLHDSVVCCYRNSGINDQGLCWNPPIHATMLRDERYKLNIYHADPHVGRPVEGELYDMQADPQELLNLWNHRDYQHIRQHMTEGLLEWLFRQELSTGSRGGEALPDRSQQLVNALK